MRQFERDNTEYIARSLKLVRLMGMLWPTLETLLGIAIVIVLFVGGREVLLHRITVGSFVAFNTYMVQLTWPIIALGWVINLFQRGTASMGRIHNILSEQPEITDAPESERVILSAGAAPLRAGVEGPAWTILRRASDHANSSRRHRVSQSQLPLRQDAARGQGGNGTHAMMKS